MNNQHINAFDYDMDLGLIFWGTKDGELVSYQANQSKVNHLEKNAHIGTIESIHVCKTRQYVATLGGDRRICVYKYNIDGELQSIFECSIRNLGNDEYLPVHSTSQAIFIHPTKPIIATRSGSACCIEIDFETGRTLSVCRPLQQDLATIRYSSDGSYILAGSNSGEIAIIKDGKCINYLKLDEINETVHWFEPLSDSEYIVATDARRLLHLSIDSDNMDVSYRLGCVFSGDDFEHVTLHPVTKRCIATSFDKKAYEIDTEELEPLKVAYIAPFKIRWVKFIDPADDSKIALQVRDGSILFVDINKGHLISSVKNTPDAMWTSLAVNDKLYFAGENGTLIEITSIKNEKKNYYFKVDTGGAYIKRMVTGGGDRIILGTTKGDIFEWSNGVFTNKIKLNEPIRDIVYDNVKNIIYAATEGGNVYSVNSDDVVSSVYQSNEPIWSISLSPDNSKLSIGERLGKIVIIDAGTGLEIDHSFSRIPKRILWISNNSFLVTHSGRLDKFTLSDNGSWEHNTGFINPDFNTVEDFAMLSNRYVCLITYNRRIFLADINNGEILDSIYDSADYMKTILPISPCVFTVAGRDGLLKTYRVHNEQIMCIGIEDMYKEDMLDLGSK